VEAPILIDFWTVESAGRDELVRRVSELMHNHVLGRPGFMSAQIYESADGRSVMAIVHMRTAKDRQHLTDSPEAHAAYRELRAIARTHARLFRLVESFGDAA
jgi:hypothetical protein